MLGAILQGIGALTNIVGGIGAINSAKEAAAGAESFGKQQKDIYTKGMSDIIASAKTAPVYKGDISLYKKAQQAAEEANMMAGGRVSGIDRLRENVRQGTANALAVGIKGAQSASDVMALAGLGQAGEAESMRNLDVQELQTSQALKAQAQQNYLASLGQTAGAQATQAGLEFNSQQQNFQQLLGLQQQQLQGGMSIDQANYERNAAAAAAVANAKLALWSGGGGALQKTGEGLMAMSQADKQMANLKDMWASANKGQSAGGSVGDLLSMFKSQQYAPMSGYSVPASTSFTLPTLALPL